MRPEEADNKLQPLAHLGQPALRQNLAESGWSALGGVWAKAAICSTQPSSSIGHSRITPVEPF